MNPIIQQQIPNAQVAFQRLPFRKGQVVAHPDEPITGELESLDEATGLALVSFPNQPSQQFPYKELFDPNELLRMCRDAQAQEYVIAAKQAGFEVKVVEL